MALNQDQATGLAKELMMALAQSGSLPIHGNTGAVAVAHGAGRAAADAEYLTTLYRDLVAGLQK